MVVGNLKIPGKFFNPSTTDNVGKKFFNLKSE